MSLGGPWAWLLGLPTAVVYGSLALFVSVLHNVFLLYYVDTFVSVYKIDKVAFWVGEVGQHWGSQPGWEPGRWQGRVPPSQEQRVSWLAHQDSVRKGRAGGSQWGLCQLSRPLSCQLGTVCTFIIHSRVFISGALDGGSLMGAVAVGYGRGTDLSTGLQAGELASSLRDGEQAGVRKALERRPPGAHLPVSPLPTDGVSPLEQSQRPPLRLAE